MILTDRHGQTHGQTETNRQMDRKRTDRRTDMDRHRQTDFVSAVEKLASNPQDYSLWNTGHGTPARLMDHGDSASTSTSTTTSKTITTTITATTTTTTLTITLVDTNEGSYYCG